MLSGAFINRRLTMTDVATWSQLLSSIAVLGTLIYLAVETKQNTAAQHAATRVAIESGTRAAFHTSIDHPDIILSVMKLEPLLPEETVRLNAYLRTFMYQMEYVWRQHKAGAAEWDAWNSQALAIRSMLKTKRSERWWQAAGRNYFEASFVEAVEALLKDQPYTEVFDNTQAWGSEDLRG
jgi:hypothetical protein